MRSRLTFTGTISSAILRITSRMVMSRARHPLALSPIRQDLANAVSMTTHPGFLVYALIKARRLIREIANWATHKTIYMPALQTSILTVASMTKIEDRGWIKGSVGLGDQSPPGTAQLRDSR